MSQKQLEHSLMYNVYSDDINDRQNEIEGGLFNNPMINAAIKALSIEDKEKYKKIGDDLYGTINYVDIVNEGQHISENIPDDAIEAVLYIESQLRSGLHPVDMGVDEINLMANAYGDEWYSKWNYTKQDLTEIN
jgi:hypothetical protein